MQSPLRQEERDSLIHVFNQEGLQDERMEAINKLYFKGELSESDYAQFLIAHALFSFYSDGIETYVRS